MNNSVTAIILAAGSGSRMNIGITKQRMVLNNETVLRRTVRIFNECADVDSIVVVVRSDEVDFAKTETGGFEKVLRIVVGGKCRAESAKLGFLAAEKADYIAIHDAARCFVTSEMISRVLKDARIYGAATASSRITDTVKLIDSNMRVTETIDRNKLFAVQTPQIFRYELYSKAISEVDIEDPAITDDNSLLERIGVYSFCTETGVKNIKLTTPEDIIFVNGLLNGDEND